MICKKNIEYKQKEDQKLNDIDKWFLDPIVVRGQDNIEKDKIKIDQDVRIVSDIKEFLDKLKNAEDKDTNKIYKWLCRPQYISQIVARPETEIEKLLCIIEYISLLNSIFGCKT